MEGHLEEKIHICTNEVDRPLGGAIKGPKLGNIIKSLTKNLLKNHQLIEIQPVISSIDGMNHHFDIQIQACTNEGRPQGLLHPK